MSKKLKFFGFIFIAFVALASLNSCASLKGGTGNAQTESAVGKLSATIQQMDAKVPAFVQSFFTDAATIDDITKQHLADLKDPLDGFAAAMYEEWMSYSNANANRDNETYKPFTLALPKAKGPLSSKVAAAINGQLTKVFNDQRIAFKKCRESGATDKCKAAFVEKTTKQLGEIIKAEIMKYYKARVEKL